MQHHATITVYGMSTLPFAAATSSALRPQTAPNVDIQTKVYEVFDSIQIWPSIAVFCWYQRFPCESLRRSRRHIQLPSNYQTSFKMRRLLTSLPHSTRHVAEFQLSGLWINQRLYRCAPWSLPSSTGSNLVFTSRVFLWISENEK